MLRRLSTWRTFRRSVLATARAQPSAGDRDIVVIPCWRRPEFLWQCLENLACNEEIDSVHLLFRVDTGFAEETLQVIHAFADRFASFEIEYALASPFRRTKPSANFLFGLLHAALRARQLVFLVEEDIMVARDYIRWTRAVHRAAAPLFCSIPVKNPNRALTLPADAAGYYLSSGDSCSNGMCFDKRVLLELVAPHFNMSYLRQPKKYIRRRFPHSRIGLGFVEQDGLIRRIQEQSPYPIGWPCVPRAFHAGFFGARGGWQNFRSGPNEALPLAERVRAIADTIYSPEALRAAIDDPQFLEICMPCELRVAPWSELHRVDVPAPADAPPEIQRRLQGGP